MEEKKVVFVTGASRGIGKDVALKFAEKGYDVIINYVSDKTDVETLKKEFAEKGADSLILKADVSKEEEVKDVVEKAIEKFGKIDVLVNNAGITRDNLLMRMSTEDFDKVIDINLKGTFLVTKAVTKYMMKKRCGSIVNISSDNTIDYYDMVTLEYDVSKAGLNLMTKTFANYFKQAHVNAILFDWLDTPMNDFTEDEKKYISFVPMKVAVSKIQELIETKESGRLELVKK